jgi:hypothetical protein
MTLNNRSVFEKTRLPERGCRIQASVKTYTQTRKELVGRLYSLRRVMTLIPADRERYQADFNATAMRLAELEVGHYAAKAQKSDQWFAKFAQRRAQEARHGVFVASEGQDAGSGSETPLNAVQEAGK